MQSNVSKRVATCQIIENINLLIELLYSREVQLIDIGTSVEHLENSYCIVF